MKRLYHTGSSKEGGTLLQLRNLINRRNVSGSKDIMKQVNEVEDFLELVVNCHLIAVTMHFFQMSCISDEPHRNAFPSNIADLELNSRKKLFYEKLAMTMLCHLNSKQNVRLLCLRLHVTRIIIALPLNTIMVQYLLYIITVVYHLL